MIQRRLLPCAAPILAPALVVALAVPAYAAVSYSYSASFFDYSAAGDSSSDSIVLSCAGGEMVPASVPPAPCPTLDRIFVAPGSGSDSVDLSGLVASDFPALTNITVVDDNDFVADSITGSDLPEIYTLGNQDDVDAGGGDDVIEGGDQVDGGAGDDVLFEAGGAGGADGGPGDDRFVQTIAQGGNDGGSGYDVMELDFDKSGFRTDEVSIEATAAQLRVSVPGEEQNIFMVSFEELHVQMVRGVNQTFDATAFPGSVVYRGSRQDDTFTGSPQQDIVNTGKGGDTVMTRDGGFDLVDCGAGTDSAVVDAVDRVVNCESVSYPRPQTSSISGPRKIKKGASAAYSFGSSTDGAVFQCRVDKAKWKSCTSPYTVKATGKLKKGKHTLFVRAGYPAGNWDKSPAKKKITIKR